MTRSVLLILTLIFAATGVNAQTAKELLQKDLSKAVFTFNKQIQLFHYFNAPLDPTGTQLDPWLSQKENRDPWIVNLLGVRAGWFWDLNYTNMDYVNAGPGIYFAIDPDSSKEFGNSALILKTSADSKFLSVLKATPLSSQTINALLNENIVSKSQMNVSEKTLNLKSGFTRFALKNMLLPENTEFRKLIISIFTDNNIQFVEYEYKSHLAGFCKISSQSAFVFIGAAPSVGSSSQQVAATIDEHFKNTLLYSPMGVGNPTADEATIYDLTNRFKYILSQIRIQGTAAAKNLIQTTLINEEVDRLASISYKCVRRH